MKFLSIIAVISFLASTPSMGGSYNLNLGDTASSAEQAEVAFADLLESSTRFYNRYELGIDWQGVAAQVLEEAELPSEMAVATANKVAADLLYIQESTKALQAH